MRRPRLAPMPNHGMADMGCPGPDAGAHTKASRARDTERGVYGSHARRSNADDAAGEHPRATRRRSVTSSSDSGLERVPPSSAATFVVPTPWAAGGSGHRVTRESSEFTPGAHDDGSARGDWSEFPPGEHCDGSPRGEESEFPPGENSMRRVAPSCSPHVNLAGSCSGRAHTLTSCESGRFVRRPGAYRSAHVNLAGSCARPAAAPPRRRSSANRHHEGRPSGAPFGIGLG
jgi:hypothetical protein